MNEAEVVADSTSLRYPERIRNFYKGFGESNLDLCRKPSQILKTNKKGGLLSRFTFRGRRSYDFTSNDLLDLVPSRKMLGTLS
jgi:hypothetical protein